MWLERAIEVFLFSLLVYSLVNYGAHEPLMWAIITILYFVTGPKRWVKLY